MCHYGSDWKSHSLKFDDKGGGAGGYMASVDDYVVSDPLLDKGKEKFLGSKAGKKMTAWAGGSFE